MPQRSMHEVLPSLLLLPLLVQQMPRHRSRLPCASSRSEEFEKVNARR